MQSLYNVDQSLGQASDKENRCPVLGFRGKTSPQKPIRPRQYSLLPPVAERLQRMDKKGAMVLEGELRRVPGCISRLSGHARQL